MRKQIRKKRNSLEMYPVDTSKNQMEVERSYSVRLNPKKAGESFRSPKSIIPTRPEHRAAKTVKTHRKRRPSISSPNLVENDLDHPRYGADLRRKDTIVLSSYKTQVVHKPSVSENVSELSFDKQRPVLASVRDGLVGDVMQIYHGWPGESLRWKNVEILSYSLLKDLHLLRFSDENSDWIDLRAATVRFPDSDSLL